MASWQCVAPSPVCLRLSPDVQEIHHWAASRPLEERPWLLAGKGPTFGRVDEFDLDRFNVMTLNHAVLEIDATLAHVIDIDVVEDCGDALVQRARWVVMPRVPHVRQRPGHVRLEDYVQASPLLRRLDEEDRLLWYNAETGPRLDGAPVVEVRYFSSEAALGILGILGTRTVRTIGVDGGASYAPAFSTRFAGGLLANGQPSFDQQFAEMRRIARRYQMDVRPLVEVLKVFVGAGPADIVPYRVLAHSIHRHASQPARVEMLPAAEGPTPADRSNRPRTAFSFSRFMIPALCDHEGSAVYVDSDMLVFADIAELFDHARRGAAVACTKQPAPEAWRDGGWFRSGRQFSVMTLNCGQLDWDIDAIVAALDDGRYTYESVLFDLAVVDEDEIDDTLDPRWNCLEHYEDDTKLLHFTVVPTQPWLSTSNPNRDIWLDAFRSAVGDGAVPRDEVEALVDRGGAPDLLEIYDEAAAKKEVIGDQPLLAVALDGAFRRIDELQSARLRHRVRRSASRLSPLVRRARRRWGNTAGTRIVETVAELARRALR